MGCNGLSLLHPRERRIFERRRLADQPAYLDELAREFGVSRERVRQIEVSAFKKVQKAVKVRMTTAETVDGRRSSASVVRECASAELWSRSRKLLPA
jgi:hypothetical protein